MVILPILHILAFFYLNYLVYWMNGPFKSKFLKNAVHDKRT